VTAHPPRQRLYLITPLVDDAASFAPELERVLGSGDVAAVLLRLAQGGELSLIERVKTIGAAVHSRDIALVVDGHPEIVARAGADGSHLTGITVFAAALAALKPDRIAGAGGLRSRHDAMLAGETAADYVMFGEPERRGPGKNPPFPAVEERVAWWAELFQPPCIGYASSADQIRPLAQAGADFVALGEWIWSEQAGAERTLAAAGQSLAAAAG